MGEDKQGARVGLFDDITLNPSKKGDGEKGKEELFEWESVRIDPLDLNREYQELPPRLSYWNHCLADASQKSMVAKVDLERARARAYLEEKAIAAATGKKPTVPELEARVVLNDTVCDAHDRYVLAEGDRLRIKGIVASINSKQEMLQSLGAKLRAEMRSDPVLRDQLAGRSGMDFGGD